MFLSITHTNRAAGTVEDKQLNIGRERNSDVNRSLDKVADGRWYPDVLSTAKEKSPLISLFGGARKHKSKRNILYLETKVHSLEKKSDRTQKALFRMNISFRTLIASYSSRNQFRKSMAGESRVYSWKFESLWLELKANDSSSL